MSAKRASEKISFWIYCAREIEGKFFNSVFRHLYNGHLFGRGQAIEFLLEGTLRSRRMKFWGRLAKGRVLLNFITLVFAIMYISVIVIEVIS